MKSLLISSDYFPPQIGGISHLLENIATSLGSDQVCCLTNVPGERISEKANDPIRVYQRVGGFSKYKVLRGIGFGVSLLHIMLRERPQVVQLGNIFEGSLGLWIQDLFKIPFVVYAHGNEILRAIHENLSMPLLTLQRAERVLAVSHFTADLVKSAGVPSHRIEVVSPGCDAQRFCPHQPSMDLKKQLLGERYQDRVILTVGNLVARKGQDMVIRALPQLLQQFPDTTYLIVGKGPYRESLSQLAKTVGVDDHVVFTGSLDVDLLPEVYALSDLFVMASRDQRDKADVEGFGLVFLEASACGKPVVGGHSGGIADAIVDGVTGLLVNPEDPKDIGGALSRLFSDRDLAERLGRQGRQRVVKEFSWAQVGRKVKNILESVINEEGKVMRRCQVCTLL